MTSQVFDHEKISPTAKLVAYWRQFSDIPFGKDVASLFKVEAVYRGMLDDPNADWPQEELMAPYLESRYKSIGQFIKKSAVPQVLEFASGISLRGLAMTTDPAMTYIETDLPGLTQEKVKIVNAITDKNNIKKSKNLFFYNTNILNWAEIEPTLQHFDPNRPLIIAHEGLFQYLTKAEKATAAKNIHKILSRFGGTWITPDLDTKSQRLLLAFDPKNYQKFSDIIEKTTGRNFERNSFEDDAEIQSFFGDLGFNVKWQPQMDGELELSTLAQKQPSPKIMTALKSLRLWVLTTKT